MGLEELTPRSAFLLFVGAATTVFFIMGGTALWEHKYLPGVFFLISGTALTYIFFRKGEDCSTLYWPDFHPRERWFD